jgi:hypothetical protein
LVLAVPDCIAVLAGLYMRAVVMNGGALRLVSAAWHTGTGPVVKAMQAKAPFRGKEWRFRCVAEYDRTHMEQQDK